MAYVKQEDEQSYSSLELELTPRKSSDIIGTVKTEYVHEEDVNHYSVIRQAPKGIKYIFNGDIKTKLKPLRRVGYMGAVVVLVIVIILLTVLLATIGGEAAGHAEPLADNLRVPIPGGWGHWSSFSECSQSCGGGSQYLVRRCDSPRPDNGGSWCDGEDVETRACNMEVCPVDGIWNNWNNWTVCSKSCGRGAQYRTRKCLFPSVGAPRGVDCIGPTSNHQTCNTNLCPADGQWTAWENWSDCSKNCGNDTRSRSRRCYFPANVPHGAPCSGDEKQSETCITDPCPITFYQILNHERYPGHWTQWSQYSTCSLTCGKGTRSRNRTCIDHVLPTSSSRCFGPSEETETCTTTPCRADGVWSVWTNWEGCSKSCDTGVRLRTRNCTYPEGSPHGAQCHGPRTEHELCGTKLCPRDGFWAAWSQWADCSQTCGGGTKFRARACAFEPGHPHGEACEGDSEEHASCIIQECSLDGVWTQWTNWRSCSATCGAGLQVRMRVCFYPGPLDHHGKKCTGLRFETRSCAAQACPVDGEWGQWTAWGACSASCDTGTKMRYRVCLYNATGPHGADCQGSDQETSFCSTNTCPVDGVWTQWTNWGACSVTCASGVQERTRTCSYPNPIAPHGNKCTGVSVNTQPCTAPQNCPEAKLRDCKDVLDFGRGRHEGLHRIDLGQTKEYVYCDMTTSGGGWTVIMYRKDAQTDFLHKDSIDYALGFGDKDNSFWQGLEDIHALTSDGRRYQLRVDVQAANGSLYYEVYDDFSIGPAKNFTLHIGSYRGTAGDSLSGHNGLGFTTYDRDVDSNPSTNCAVYLGGSWWFHDCYDSCLTCEYVSAPPETMECASMSWNAVKYCEPLRMAKMMIRPM